MMVAAPAEPPSRNAHAMPRRPLPWSTPESAQPMASSMSRLHSPITSYGKLWNLVLVAKAASLSMMVLLTASDQRSFKTPSYLEAYLHKTCSVGRFFF